MDANNKISRRSALKRMGVAVIGGAIASSGLLSLSSCKDKSGKDKPRKRAIQFAPQEPGVFPDGTEKNPNARYRNEHISLMDIKKANNQQL